jgi:hypothetical protein
MRVWSEDEGRYIECESIWDGRNPMPHELKDREVWRYTGNALLEAAPGKGSMLNAADKKAIARAAVKPDVGMNHWRSRKQRAVWSKCACGRQRKHDRALCKRCHDKRRQVMPCACGGRVPNWEFRLGVRRCKPCRTAHPAKGQEAAA